MKIALFGTAKPDITAQITSILTSLGISYLDAENPYSLTPNASTQLEGIDMAFSIGGDGTFLRTAAKIGRMDIPILGINAGHLGFLADVQLDEIATAIPEIVMQKRFVVEHRTLLHLDIPGCSQKFQQDVLNEVAVLKRDVSSMVTVSVSVDGTLLNKYSADGVIFATPTGSTAYALSAGGAILQPQSHCMEIVPIAAHSLTARPLVIKDSAVIDIEVSSRNNLFLVATDGLPLHLTTQYHLQIRKSDYTIGVVRRPESNFYDTLRNKLKF